mgnify:CR=1 FL=1
MVKSGKSALVLGIPVTMEVMLNLLGEHTCRIDAKGRLMFPARLRRQLEKVLHHGLVINRDIFEKCLEFLDTRVALDQTGFKFDIFEH